MDTVGETEDDIFKKIDKIYEVGNQSTKNYHSLVSFMPTDNSYLTNPCTMKEIKEMSESGCLLKMTQT